MSVMIGNKIIWRTLALAVLIVSMLGTWSFDLLNVPAQYPCQPPVVRLYGDFCGYPMSGFGAIVYVSSSYPYILDALIHGNLTGLLPDFVALLFTWIILFPFISAALLVWKRNSRRLQILNLTVWGLACLAAVAIFVVQSNRDQFVSFFYLFWGLLLYILVAIGTVILEILVLASNTKQGPVM